MQAAAGGSKRVELTGSQELPLFGGRCYEESRSGMLITSKRYGSWFHGMESQIGIAIPLSLADTTYN